MNLSKELITSLGFEEVEINEYNMYKRYFHGEPLYLEKVSKEKEFYIIYKKDKNDNFKDCGHCCNFTELFENIINIIEEDCIKLGQEIKRQEIKTVLGIN